MIKRYTLSICLFMLILSAQAQQDAIISTYQFNQLPINPAYEGAHNFTNIDLHYRNQWGDVEGAPSSVFFSANTFLPSKNMGAGLYIHHDAIGVTTQTRAFIGSSYKLHLSNDQSLTFGLNIGIISLKYDFNELLLEDPTDEDFMNGNDRLSKFNIGSGLLFTKADKYYVGISAPQLLKMNETIAGFEGTRYYPHYYATAGVVFEVSRTFIKPYTNIRMVSRAPISYDLGVSALFKERIWAGLFTRNFSNAGLNMFLTLENGMRLGYSGELVVGDPQVSSGYSTHEVSIGIDLNWLEGQTVKRRFF